MFHRARRADVCGRAQAFAWRVPKAPSTGETLPAIGLGTFMTFDLLPGQRRDHLGEVMRRYWEAGCRVIDPSPLYGSGEVTAGGFGIADRMFISNKLWATGDHLADASVVEQNLQRSNLRLWRDPIDLARRLGLLD